MKTRILIALVAIFIMLPLAAQEAEPVTPPPTDDEAPIEGTLPAGSVAHGASEEAYEEAYPEEEHGEHEERTYFGIPAWVLKLLNMLLFFGLLAYLVKGPITRAFADRKKAVRSRLSEADVRRERADRMAEEIQERLAKVEGEIEAIRNRADEEGARQSRQIDEAATREAEKIRQAARGEIDQRLTQARRELQEFAADLATERATGIVESSINDADRAKLFESSVASIREAKS